MLPNYAPTQITKYMSRGTFSPRREHNDDNDPTDKLKVAEDIKNLIRKPLCKSLKRSSHKKKKGHQTDPPS